MQKQPITPKLLELGLAFPVVNHPPPLPPLHPPAPPPPHEPTWVTTISRLLKIIGLFAKEPCKRDYILQKRPVILRSLPHDPTSPVESWFICSWIMVHMYKSCAYIMYGWHMHVYTHTDTHRLTHTDTRRLTHTDTHRLTHTDTHKGVHTSCLDDIWMSHVHVSFTHTDTHRHTSWLICTGVLIQRETWGAHIWRSESCYSQSHLGWHFRKLKAQSSNDSFVTFQWKEMLELWALSFETAFENVTPSGIGCICTGGMSRVWCHMWMSHVICIQSMPRVTYEWVMSYVQEACHVYNVTYEWVVCLLSHMNESCHLYIYIYIWIYIYIYVNIYTSTRMMSNMNESWHTYEWVTAHMNESCHLYRKDDACMMSCMWLASFVSPGTHMSESQHIFEWVMVHISMSHVTHMKKASHIQKCVMALTWTIHESWPSYDWVTSHISRSHGTHINESCHAYEGGKSHTETSHITHMNDKCHIWGGYGQ